jgi:hypothetical protein
MSQSMHVGANEGTGLMRVERSAVRVWAGRAAALCAAPLIMVAVAAPPAAAGTSPGEPDAERISAGPYEGFQMCQTGAALLVTSASPTLAASPTASLGSTHPPFAPFPSLTGTFEVTTPQGQLLIRQATQIENGRLFVLQVTQGRLSDGQYRWRVRAEDGTAVSTWTPWCNFALRTSG